MNALYNEIEGFAADWLDNLIAGGHIASGRVERRSIADLAPADVAGPGQRHFFAGIGGWSYALRLAGIPDDADVWTGSCPCQPFSSAGKRGGTSDPRHLWPAWFALIRECRPPVIFGEQVASPDGLVWLDAIYADLERCGYAVGASILSAAGVGAPHQRHRIYFVADARGERREGKRLRVRTRRPRSASHETGGGQRSSSTRGQSLELGDSHSLSSRRHSSPVPGAQGSDSSMRSRDHRSGVASEDVDQGYLEHADEHAAEHNANAGGSGVARLRLAAGDAGEAGSRLADGIGDGRQGSESAGTAARPTVGSSMSPWSDAQWIDCSDGKRRPIPTEPALFPLASGVPNRVGLLRGSGNAIVPQVAAVFIKAAIGEE